VTILNHSFRIDENKVEQLKLSKKEYKKKTRLFDCTHYLLYKIQEPNFEKWLSGITDKNPVYTGEYDQFLMDNYIKVDEPQANDIIVYLDESQNPIHFGILSDANTVHSKWGLIPYIFSHSLHTTPYGNNIVFLRKGFC
jgi:hypothetical protein